MIRLFDGFSMDDEVVIIEVAPKTIGFDNFDCDPGTTSAKCYYEKELYMVNQPITRRPEYIVIRDRGTPIISLCCSRSTYLGSYLRQNKLFPKENS